MKEKTCWTKHIVQLLIIFIFFIFLLKLSQKAAEMARDFNYNPWMFIGGKFGMYISFGILLGFERLYEQLRKAGEWKINTPKIVLLGIPSIIFSLSTIIYYGVEIPKYPILEQIFRPFIVAKSPEMLAQILFGYVLVTSFYKADLSHGNSMFQNNNLT